MQLVLQHLHLDVDVELTLEEVRQPRLNTRMQLLTALHIDFKGLTLAHILPELAIIARQDKLHELVVAQTATVVEIVELHHKLHILNAELCSIGLLEVVIDVVGVDELDAISVNSAECGIRLEIVEVREVLPCLLDAELEIGEVPEVVDQFLLGLS